jgi:aminoglycoside 6'-N-acetyltransferase I
MMSDGLPSLMTIRQAVHGDEPEWLRMRELLWSDQEPDERLHEVRQYLGIDGPPLDPPNVVFVADRGKGRLGGFLEVTTHASAEGCGTSPVGYLEGWWVDEDLRLQGVGRALVSAAEEWARGLGYTEMASDTDDFRPWSVAAHQRLGYSVTSAGKEIRFRKPL